MKLTLVGYGTRGDVQPYVALGWELTRRGHDVTLCAPVSIRDFVERSGLRFVPLPMDVPRLLGSPEAQRMLAGGRFGEFIKWLEGENERHRAGILAALLSACSGAEAVVSHPLLDNHLAAIGAHLRVPVVPLYLYPVVPTGEFPSIFLARRGLGPLNRLSYRLVARIIWKGVSAAVAAQRQELGVAATDGPFSKQVQERQMLALISHSPELQPRPADWPSHAVSCAGIDLPEELRSKLGEQGLSDELTQWLDNGPPPIYVGFGSMPVLHPAAMLAITRRVLERLDARAVICAGWSELVETSDARIRIIGSADHTALFARCRAAVHHGGAGTTYATLRAGLPTVICSVFADQPYWGARLERLGIGATFPFHKLSEQRLEKALRHVLSEPVTARARAVGERARRERGLEEVVDALLAGLPGATPPD